MDFYHSRTFIVRSILIMLCAVFYTGSIQASDVITDKSAFQPQQAQPGQSYVPNQVLVKYKRSAIVRDNALLNFRAATAGRSDKQRARRFVSSRPAVRRQAKGSEFAKLQSRLSSGKQTRLDQWVLVDVENGTDIEKLVKELRSDPDVEWAEPNYMAFADETPNDARFDELWGMNNTGQTYPASAIWGSDVGDTATPDADIDAAEAWDTTSGSCGNVVVAIIDTGIDYRHAELNDGTTSHVWVNQDEIPGNFIDDDNNGYVDDIYGYDFANNDSDPMDDFGHGTHVAGTIGAIGDNNVGVAGVCRNNVKIMAVKFLGSNGSGSFEAAANAIRYAADNGAKVSNNSWGGKLYGYEQYVKILQDAISDANDQGMLIVAAAGNSSEQSDGLIDKDSRYYPQGIQLPNVISVGASDFHDQPAGFTNYGINSVDLSAPGVAILSIVPQISCALCDSSGYKYLAGTSMATPHVAGVAAMLLGQGMYGDVNAPDPNWTRKVKARLMASVEEKEPLATRSISGGRLNAYNALNCSSTQPILRLGVEQGQIVYYAEDAFPIKAYLYNCEDFLLGATVQVSFDNGDPNITLYDDGLHDDEQANDGIYATLWNPQTLGPVNITVTATHSNGVVSENASALVKRRYYKYENSPYDWIDITGTGTQHDLPRNGEVTLPLGFDFSYYGQPQNQLTISANGYLTFKDNVSSFVPAGFPDPQKPNALVAPFHAGLYAGNDSFVYTQVLDTAPNRRFVVTWSNAYTTYMLSDPITFQAILYESSGDVIFQYQDVDSGLPWWSNFGANAEVGVEDYYGLDGTQYLYNAPTPYASPVKTLSNESAVRFFALGFPADSQAPVALANIPATGFVNSTVTFDGSGSSDSAGNPLTYLWDFGDGSINTGVSVGHSYSTPGSYNVSLIVYNGIVYSTPYAGTIDITTGTTSFAIEANSITAPSQVNIGEQIALEASVRNSGTGSGLTNVYFYLSTDNVPGGDIYLGSLLSPTLDGGQSATVTSNPYVPVTLAPGNYYVIVKAGTASEVGPQVQIGTGIDLVVTEVFAPAKARAGDHVTLNFTLENRGSGRVYGEALTDFYLYPDDGSAPLRVGSLSTYVGNDGTQIQSAQVSLSLPTTLVNGTYRWVAIADGRNQITEANADGETNNTTSGNMVTIGTGANQPPTAVISGPAQGYVGQPVTFTGTASTDPDNDPLSYYWGAPMYKYGNQISYTFTSPGTYTVTLTAKDGINDSVPVTQQIEISYGADVALQNFSISSNNVPLGATIDLRFNIANIGATDTYDGNIDADVRYYVYVDTDTNLDNGASQVTWGYTVETIAPGASVSIQLPVALEYSVVNTLAPHYVIVKLVPFGECGGCAANNVVASAPITMYRDVDFGISQLVPDRTTITLGKPINIVTGLVNNGTSQADGSVSSALYLSDDAVWDANDGQLRSWSSYAPKASQSQAYNAVNIMVSQYSYQPGHKYLLAVADNNNAFAETNSQGDAENNNVVAIPVDVVAPDIDLVVRDIVVSQSGAPITPDAFDGVSNLPAGGYINVATTVANEGSTQVPGYAGPAVKLYFSADNQFDVNDTELAAWAENNLDPLSTSTHHAPIQLDSNLAPGRYYLIAVIDPDNLFVESNLSGTAENNNIGFISLDIVAPAPDLVMTQVQTASSVLPIGSGLSFTATVLNQGVTATSRDFNVGVYLSSDTTITTSDRMLSFRNVNGLLAGEQNSAESFAAIPSTLPAGCYYLGAIADYSERVAESCSGCETNNALSGTLIAVGGASCGNNPLPTVSLSANPLDINSGGNTTLTWSSTNSTQCTANAVGDSAGWTGTRPLSGSQVLSPAQTTVYTLTCTGPGGTIASDPVEVTVSVPVPAPVVTLTVTPATIELGQSATLAWSASNADTCTASATGDTTAWSGSKSASGTQVVSPTQTTTYELVCNGAGGTGAAAPVLVTVTQPVPSVTLTASVTNLNLGESTTLTWSSTNASNCTASVDANGDANGWSGSKATSGSQLLSPTKSTTYSLSCSGAGGTASAQPPISVTVTVPAPGVSLSANPAVINAGQSTTLTWNTTNADSCMASVATGGDAAGWSGTKAVGGSQTLSPTVSSTYLLNCSGAGGSASASASVTVNDTSQPFVDVATTSLVAPASLVSGTTITVSGNVQNLGNSVTNTSVGVYFYLSADSVYDTADRYLGYTSAGLLDGGQSKPFSLSLAVPATTVAGQYHLIAVSDRYNYVTESDDPDNLNGNNTAVTNSLALTIGADVAMLSGLSAPNNAVTGSTISISGSVENIGSGATSGNVTVYFYLSADQTYDTADKYLGVSYTGVLAAGQSSSFTQNVAIPATLASGSYYLLAVADRYNYVVEQDDPDNLNGNNKAVGNAITIGIGADVAMGPTLNGPSAAVTGSTISVSGSVQNIGSGTTSGNVTVHFYLSGDQTYDTADQYLGVNYGSTLTGGQNRSFTQDVFIPATLAPGSYYLLAVADRYNYVVEQDDPDNLNGNNKVTGNMITVGIGADVAMGANLSGPGSAVAGDVISVSGSAQNIGSGVTSGNITVYFYLSSDQSYDTADKYLGTAYGSTLAAGQSWNFTQNLTIPANTAPGGYYLLAVADRYNYIVEQDDPDNLNGNNKAVGNTVTISAP